MPRRARALAEPPGARRGPRPARRSSLTRLGGVPCVGRELAAERRAGGPRGRVAPAGCGVAALARAAATSPCCAVGHGVRSLLWLRCAASPSIVAPMLGSMSTLPPTAPTARPRDPDSPLAGPVPGRRVRGRAAREAALVRARAAGRRAREPAPVAGARVLRAARRVRRDPVRGVAGRLGAMLARAGGARRGGHAGRRRRRLRLLPRERHLLARLLLRGQRPAGGGRGRPARADRPAAQAARRRGPAGAARSGCPGRCSRVRSA